MSLRRALCLLPFVVAVPLLHCGDDDAPPAVPSGDGGVVGSGEGGPGANVEPDKPLVPANKVDLLFAIDNSQSMGDKQALLSSAVSRILRRLTEESTDHKAILDLHVGVISSSLGNLGGNVCPDNNPRANDQGHLLNKTRSGSVVLGAEQGFLSFAGGDVTALEVSAKELILGAGQDGCGLEAQLESLYRFLIQPDPPSSITFDQATSALKFGPIDEVLLKQRKAFLRPDSAVGIVMLTDEDDSNVDPMWNKGLGWAFANRDFPGSKVKRGTNAQGTTAPLGTKVCETNPTSPDCLSCAFCNTSPECKAKQDANCSKSGDPPQSGEGYDGYHGPADDDLNVRFVRMKERFGADPQFPIDRYVRGLSFRKVPKRDTEHDAAGNYVHAETCTNPLFAQQLPSVASDELCNLPESARSRRLIMFQLIGGLPPSLTGSAPNWTAILGANPDAYDFTGIDPHMIQSIAPRQALLAGGSPDAKRGENGSDPISGREWDTKGKDLQYACTLALPEPRSCVGNIDSCECQDDPSQPGKPATNAPLCAPDGSATQIRGKAYPTVRELRVVKGLGDRGIASSICSADPQSGYGPLLETFATKLSGVIIK